MNVLLDLDGTLTDPGPGIVGCIQYALGKLGRQVPGNDELLHFIGPPLLDSLRDLLDSTDPAHVEQALLFYRERYSTVGLFENQVYPGIPDALKALRERGATLFVATSKPEMYAQRIIEHFGLACYFQRVLGSELSGVRSDKAALIAHIIEQEKLERRETAMVGDRMHDAVGARANGIMPVGVLWGYGDEQELTSAQCRILLRMPAELARLTV